MRILRFLVLIASLVSCPIFSDEISIAQSHNSRFSMVGIDSEAEVSDFLSKLQTWVNADKRSDVVSVVRFPISVYLGGLRVKIRSKKAFLENYERIMNKKVRSAILSQKEKELFVNWQGIMFGNGEIWINKITHKNIMITAINTT